MVRRRSNRPKSWRGGERGGNRENEQGEASSSQAAIQEALPIDSLPQSNEPARPSFPPSIVRMPPVRAPGLRLIARGPPPPSSLFSPNNQVFMDRNLRTVGKQRKGVLLWVVMNAIVYALLLGILYVGQQGSPPFPMLVQDPLCGEPSLNFPWWRTLAGDLNHDLLSEEGRKTTITAENTGSRCIRRTQCTDNITSRTQQDGLEGPVNSQDIAEEMGNQTEAQQGTTGNALKNLMMLIVRKIYPRQTKN